MESPSTLRSVPSRKDLRDGQQEVVDAAVKQESGALPVQMPTGYGKTLLDLLTERAREADCQALELDSGVQRFDAHRFYLTNRMIISSHHFRLSLQA